MRRFINYFLGTVRVVVTGSFPERVINLCAQNHVEFWKVEWRDEHTVVFTIRHCGLTDAASYADRVNCTMQVEYRDGFPEFAGKFRRRYAFLIGLACALFTAGMLSRFILTMEITGNERISDAVILQQLQRFGVHPGAYGPGLDRRQIEQEILLSLKDLSWMTINLHGTKAEIQVKETKPAPKRADESGFYHVTAEADGIITHIEPELGDALVKRGDIVGKGDILISGTVTLEPPQYSELPNRYYHLHARGRVWAKTWRSLTAAIPIETTGKNYTGEVKSVWSIIFFGKRVEFFGNSSILAGFYDRISSVRQAVLPGDIRLPVWFVRDEFRKYESEMLDITLDAAIDLLEERLKQKLTMLVGEDGQVLQVTYETRVSDGLIQVTATGECLEEIGQETYATARDLNSGGDPD